MNLGNDADTVGAIYGQLAGAYYGIDSIPEEWRKTCSLTPLIELFGTELLRLADSISVPELPVSNWNILHPPVAIETCELECIIYSESYD